LNSVPNIPEIASLIGDKSRLTILLALLDGRLLPASELARLAEISPPTASLHLSKLVQGGLILAEQMGRHRYYRLVSSDVAHALESLMTISPSRTIRSLKESEQNKQVRYARTCYDHLAGVLGVRLTQSFMNLGLLEEAGREFLVTTKGSEFLTSFGIDLAKIQHGRRVFARQCLDWSERRFHLAGSLGAANYHPFSSDRMDRAITWYKKNYDHRERAKRVARYFSG
jgi:DNA-binding transcriptional ArsR family regulator